MGFSRSVVDNQKQAVYNIDAVSGCRTVSDGYLVFALGKVCITITAVRPRPSHKYVFSSEETVNSLCYGMTCMKVNQCFIIRFP